MDCGADRCESQGHSLIWIALSQVAGMLNPLCVGVRLPERSEASTASRSPRQTS